MRSTLISYVLCSIVFYTKDQRSRKKNPRGGGGGGGGGGVRISSDGDDQHQFLLDAAFRELTTWTPLVSSGVSQFSARAMKRQKLVSLYSRGVIIHVGDVSPSRATFFLASWSLFKPKKHHKVSFTDSKVRMTNHLLIIIVINLVQERLRLTVEILYNLLTRVKV